MTYMRPFLFHFTTFLLVLCGQGIAQDRRDFSHRSAADADVRVERSDNGSMLLSVDNLRPRIGEKGQILHNSERYLFRNCDFRLPSLSTQNISVSRLRIAPRPGEHFPPHRLPALPENLSLNFWGSPAFALFAS